MSDPYFIITAHFAVRSRQRGYRVADFHAVENGKVSITPLRLDLTHASQLGATKEWLSR